jgi:hypothetical protein
MKKNLGFNHAISIALRSGKYKKIIYAIKSHNEMEIEMKSILMILVVLSCLLFLAGAQDNPHYMSTDPAIREMEISMNMPGSPVSTDPAIRNMLISMNTQVTPIVTDPALREMLKSMNMSRYLGNIPSETVAGNWQLNLSDGTNIKLKLQQSDSALFGKGQISGAISQEAYASGSVSENGMYLEVVPESGMGLYLNSVDISSPPFEGNYVAFIAGSEPQSGTIKASKNPNNG